MIEWLINLLRNRDVTLINHDSTSQLLNAEHFPNFQTIQPRNAEHETRNTERRTRSTPVHSDFPFSFSPGIHRYLPGVHESFYCLFHILW